MAFSPLETPMAREAVAAFSLERQRDQNSVEPDIRYEASYSGMKRSFDSTSSPEGITMPPSTRQTMDGSIKSHRTSEQHHVVSSARNSEADASAARANSSLSTSHPVIDATSWRNDTTTTTIRRDVADNASTFSKEASVFHPTHTPLFTRQSEGHQELTRLQQQNDFLQPSSSYNISNNDHQEQQNSLLRATMLLQQRQKQELIQLAACETLERKHQHIAAAAAAQKEYLFSQMTKNSTAAQSNHLQNLVPNGIINPQSLLDTSARPDPRYERYLPLAAKGNDLVSNEGSDGSAMLRFYLASVNREQQGNAYASMVGKLPNAYGPATSCFSSSSFLEQPRAATPSLNILWHGNQPPQNNTGLNRGPTTDVESPSAVVRLALTEDIDFLNERECFLRSECLEMFEARKLDTLSARNGRRTAIFVGQVGMRCVFCSGKRSLQNSQRAVCFPSSIKYIRKAMDNWREHHFQTCTSIPDSLRTKYTSLSRIGSVNAEQYRLEAAHKIGLVDNPEGGIRFK
eukprot:scaffold86141_cov62-Attheya_sp.AAC.1